MCNIKQTFLSHFSIITNIKMKLFLPTHRLVVTATDRGSPRLAGSATLTVIIVDQNDNSPTIPLHQEVRIPESKYIHLQECYFSFCHVSTADTFNLQTVSPDKPCV